MKSDQPLLVVDLELDVQRLSRLLDGTKRLHPHKLFLDRRDEAFDIAVALGRPHVRRARFDPDEAKLALVGIAHERDPMVVARLKARGHTLSEFAVGQPHPLAQRPKASKPPLRRPQARGPVPERFIRRLKEQLLWLRTFQTFEKVGKQRHKRLAAYSQ